MFADPSDSPAHYPRTLPVGYQGILVVVGAVGFHLSLIVFLGLDLRAISPKLICFFPLLEDLILCCNKLILRNVGLATSSISPLFAGSLGLTVFG
jgi:hypothetical protein